MRLHLAARPVALASSALVTALLAGCGGGSSGGGGAASTTAPTTSGSVAPQTSAPAAPVPTSVAPAAPVLASGTLKVLAYNVAGLPAWFSASDPVRNIPQISPKLNAYDLALCQEDFWYQGELARQALHPFRSTPLTGYSTLVGDGLTRFSRAPFVGTLARVKWTDLHGVTGHANDALSSKGFSFARHELAPGVEVDVYNVHADAGSDQGDIAARAKNFEQLARYALHFSAGRALIVAGDTNLNGQQRPQDETILVDFMGRLGLTDAARALGGAESIDRVLLRSGQGVDLTPVLWRFADEFKDAAGGDLSDHLAVHVDVAWQQVP